MADNLERIAANAKGKTVGELLAELAASGYEIEAITTREPSLIDAFNNRLRKIFARSNPR